MSHTSKTTLCEEKKNREASATKEDNFTPKEIKEREEVLHHLRRYAMTNDPGMAGLLLWIPLEIRKKSLVNAPAFTDGKRIYFTESFFSNYNKRQKLFIYLHEVLHIALQHVQRGKRMSLSKGNDYSRELHNIACDAVINFMLTSNCREAAPPPNIVDIRFILEWEDVRTKPYEKWTSEEIYQYLLKKNKKNKELFENYLKEMQRSGKLLDLDPNNENSEDPNSHESTQASNVWYERLKRAKAGCGSRGALLSLNDLPVSRTPWEKHLKDFLIARLMPELEASWNRPSRRSISLSNFIDYAEEGLDRRRGIKRLGVILDTSGSITNDMLSRFISEVNNILSKTGAECVLMECDDQVHSTKIIRNALPKTYQPMGGGGTSFIPSLAEMEKYKPDAVIYLTDTFGLFPPSPPSFPILWATWQEGSVPWGRKVVIKDLI